MDQKSATSNRKIGLKNLRRDLRAVFSRLGLSLTTTPAAAAPLPIHFVCESFITYVSYVVQHCIFN